MPQSAVLLIDLQIDFLNEEAGRMPVDRLGAEAVLQAANEILSRNALPEALPIFVLNQFPPTDRIANYFRKGAAIAGSSGAELDPRLQKPASAKVIAKANPSAFSNPELEQYLSAHEVEDLYVLGVFAEGCVRATVVEAVKRGYSVYVIASAVSTNAAWKKRFALWAMKRAGAKVLPSLPTLGPSNPSFQRAAFGSR